MHSKYIKALKPLFMFYPNAIMSVRPKLRSTFKLRIKIKHYKSMVDIKTGGRSEQNGNPKVKDVRNK